jgi:aspartate aminotransferase-like enzyme
MDGPVTDSQSGFGTFFIPGPTEVRREVLAMLTRPMIPHRSSEFEELFARLQMGLKYVFQTDRPVYIAAASATGMMEAGVRCSRPGPILSLVNGAFSERFAHIAEMCGREVVRYDVEWGSIHDVARLEAYLTKKNYAAVTVVHSETSTGALNDVRSLSDMAQSHGVSCLVDSVSGLGGAEVRATEWGLDYVLTGSQKALALPPGLAFSTASAAFIDSARHSEGRGVYFDLVEMDDFAAKGQVPTTPAVSLMYALEYQLDAIREEGIENRWKRHTSMSEMTSQWLEKCQESGIDLSNIVMPEFRSPTVSAIRFSKGLSSADFLKNVAERGIRVASGYGKLKSETFRIGHMGDHSPATLERCLAACEAAVRA